MSTQTTSDIWRGYARHRLEINQRETFLVRPESPAPGNPWVLRTMFFDAWPQVDVELLSRGWHVVFCDLFQELGSPRELDMLDVIYDWATGTIGLHTNPVVEGFSRGGLYALNWAIRHPERAAAIYLDAPVCDFRTWPCGGGGAPRFEEGWQAVLRAYKLTEAEALSGSHIPLNRLAPLLARKLPMAIVAGAVDKVVPWESNGAALVRQLIEHQVPHQLWLKPDCDHHPHSLEDPLPVADFLEDVFHAPTKANHE